jgi:DNA polymerase alpha subunit A
VSYPFDWPTLDIPWEGKTYKGVFGTTWTPTELFLIKRRIMGPCWMRVQNVEEPKTKGTSYCNYEFEIDTYKDLGVHEDARKPAPPLKALFVSMELQQPGAGAANKKSQISAIATLFTDKFNIEFSEPCKFQPSLFIQAGAGIDKQVQTDLTQMFGPSINFADKEYGVLSSFLLKMNSQDPDILIGHDLNSVFLDNLFTHIADNKIEFTSVIGRLKRSFDIMKSLNRLSKQQKTRAMTVGRLLCDTYISSQELIRESDYSLPYIAKKLFGVTVEKIEDEVNLSPYESLIRRADACLRDAHLSSRICSKLQIVQLTKQLTNVAGCLWIKSLLNARAERNEMLLMHMFWRKGYVVPDKYNDYVDWSATDGEGPKGGKGKRKNKKQGFAGGLVLDPLSGLYDDIVLLLDFNSLYPSIIREYKICFTTVERPFIEIEDARPSLKQNNPLYKDQQGDVPEDDGGYLPNHDPKLIKEQDNKKICILPEIIKNLIDRRKQVKSAIKGEKNIEKLELLDIRQKAYKLIANSIYGCLGFSFSRFYARTMAAMITNYGRNLLTGSAEKVKALGFEVIYGDTDSLMINSRQKETIKALEVGTLIKKEINMAFKSRILEIEIDGVFKSLLLLKKKKYAALKVDNYGDILGNPNPNTVVQEVFSKEIKGLDVVRRDWCVLSKEVGYKLLDLILSQRGREEICAEIYDFMEDLGRKFKASNIEFDKFVIYKQLNKLPHEYPVNSQPHACVAARLKVTKNIPDDQLLHHFINYIICQGEKNQAYATRAYSLDEVRESNAPNFQGTKLVPDYSWYANNQIINPVSRLLEYIDGIDMGRIADYVGIDKTKFKATNENADEPDEKDTNFSNLLYGRHLSKPIEWVCLNCKTLNKFTKETTAKGFKCTSPHCSQVTPISYLLNILT